MEMLIISAIFLLLTVKTSLLYYILTLLIPGFVFLAFVGSEPKKRLIFAIPASILILHWPYFTLTRLGLHIPQEYFFIVPALLLFAYILRQKEDIKSLISEAKKLKFDGRIKKETLEMLVLSAIMLAMFYYVYSIFLTAEAVPLTLGAKYIGEIEILRDDIASGKGAVGWSDKWFGGMHTFISYPIISYLIIAIDSLHIEAWQAHNRSVFLFTYLVGLYLFYFLSSIGLNRKFALTTAFIASILPPLVQVNNVAKTSLDILFLVLFIYALDNILKKNDKTNFIVLTATLLTWSMNYYLSVYDMILPVALFIIAYFIISKEDIKSAASKTASIAASGALALIISALWTVPYIYQFVTKQFALTTYSEFTRFPVQDVAELMKWFASPIEYISTPETATALKFEIYTFTTLTPVMFWLGLIAGMVVLIYALREKNRNYTYAIMSFGLIAFIAFQLTPLRDIIPAYFAIYGQIYPYLPLAIFMSINIGLFMLILSKESKKYINRDISWALIIILLIVLFPTIQYSHNLGQFLREVSVTSREPFASLYTAVDYYGKDGSFILFGIYGPGLIPALTKYTSVQAFSGYGYDSHTTLQQYEKRILPFQEGTMDNLLTDNPFYAYNVFKQSNVRVLIFNVCQDSGKKSYETLVKDMRFKELVKSQCIILLGTDKPERVETIALTEVLVENPQYDESSEVKRHGSHDTLPKFLNNREKAINALLGIPGGEHMHFTADEFSFPKQYYSNIIINRTATKEEIESYLKNNSTVIYFRDDIKIDSPNFHAYANYPGNITELDDIFSKIKIIDMPVKAERKDNAWTFSNNGLTLIKETYYSKWHSNAAIKESYLGFMIADSKGDTKIAIGNTNLELIGGIITIIGYIIMIILIQRKKTLNIGNSEKTKEGSLDEKEEAKGTKRKRRNRK